MKKIFIILLFSIFYFLFSYSVQAVQDDGIYTYHFYLYFDQGKLVQDRDFQTAFDLVAEQFVSPTVSGTVYQGQILSVHDKLLGNFSFSTPTSGKGKLTAMAPYFDNAKTANFYNDQGQKLLTLDLAPNGSVCNEDGQCNSSTGETNLNCPSDCSAPTPSPSIVPVAVPSSSFLDFFSPIVLLIILAIILVLVLTWLWLRRKRNMPPPENTPTTPI